jgi:hypothetical protein
MSPSNAFVASLVHASFGHIVRAVTASKLPNLLAAGPSIHEFRRAPGAARIVIIEIVKISAQ